MSTITVKGAVDFGGKTVRGAVSTASVTVRGSLSSQSSSVGRTELSSVASSDKTVRGAVSTAGVSVRGSVDSLSAAVPYPGPYFITPDENRHVLQTAGKTASTNITVEPIPSNYGLITWNGSVLTVS